MIPQIVGETGFTNFEYKPSKHRTNDTELMFPFSFPFKIKNSLLTVVTESFKYPRRDLNPYVLADTGF